jgi:hypothetical protein
MPYARESSTPGGENAAESAYREAAVGWLSVDDAGRGAAMELRTRVLVFRAGLLLRRANYRRRRQLEAELATYSSQADLNDLCALLDTYPDAQTQEIRQILCRQQMRRIRTAGGTRSPAT